MHVKFDQMHGLCLFFFLLLFHGSVGSRQTSPPVLRFRDSTVGRRSVAAA